MMQIVSLWVVALFMMSILALETAATTLRELEDGDGGGDGGDAGGLGGALAGMLGGDVGGGGDGNGADDDDDANMVGSKHNKNAPKGSFDSHALEQSLQSGGVDQLTTMLKMMKAAQTGPAAMNIIKGPDGEDMYDMRDLDPSTTTFAPITIEKPTMPPAKVQVAGPSIKMDANGKIRWLAAAEAQQAKGAGKLAAHDRKKRAVEPVIAAVPQPQAMVQVGTPAGGQSIAAAPPAPAAIQPTAAAPVLGAPIMSQQAPVGVPMMMMATPPLPMSQISAPGSNSEAGLYQGLAVLNQNMNVLMGEAAALAKKEANPDAGLLTTKLDQASKSFLAYQDKMEIRVKGLEDENAVLKKQMYEQAHEIKEMEQEVAHAAV
jgi:hypothetical protein